MSSLAKITEENKTVIGTAIVSNTKKIASLPYGDSFFHTRFIKPADVLKKMDDSLGFLALGMSAHLFQKGGAQYNGISLK
jgi:hypothetical protein